MKKPTLLLAFVLFNLFLTAQNVGIGTNTPVARLHVADSSVVFTGPPNDSLTRNNPPPISGTGTRMMWYADRGAFRAGTVHGNIWDKDYIGEYSFGSGYDVSARGFGACATGTNTLALGNYSFASGYGTTAFGEYTTAMGIGTFAFTKYSTAIGKYNSSVANALFEIGNGTSAHSGNALTVLENGNVGIGYVAPSNPLTFLASSGKKYHYSPDQQVMPDLP